MEEKWLVNYNLVYNISAPSLINEIHAFFLNGVIKCA